MRLNAVELSFCDERGSARHLRLAQLDRSERDGMILSKRSGPLTNGAIVSVTVENRGPTPVKLDWVSFYLSSGIRLPLRFFKHGFQSWSASGPAPLGTIKDDGGRESLVRVSHRSEAQPPSGYPESANSELFTIVESDDSERFFAGFIGSAHQFTVLTVTREGEVIARALLDRVCLRPGERREIEPLAYWRSAEEAATGAARWAAILGSRMKARVGAPYQRGWCSWYHYFDRVSEDAIRANLRALTRLRTEYPIEVVQLDDGYQAAVGDWERTNAKFPSGLKRLADEIREAGFVAGLWTAPFLATRESDLMRQHPDWFIRDAHGDARRAVYNPAWTNGGDQHAYALDATHPEFSNHLQQLFSRIVEQFGYHYLKLDFLFAAALEGNRHNPEVTRAEVLRRGLEAIRRAAGESTFILGCGCPLGPAIGVVDGMRIGPDVAPYWGGDSEPGTRLAINAIVARSFMHRRLWLNDPDCLMLRATATRLSEEERFALAASIAASGGMLLVSDALSLLDGGSAELFRLVAEIGQAVDQASAQVPPLAGELMATGPLKQIAARTARGALYLCLNLGEHPQALPPAMVPRANHEVIGPRGVSSMGERLVLPPHSARIVRRL